MQSAARWGWRARTFLGRLIGGRVAERLSFGPDRIGQPWFPWVLSWREAEAGRFALWLPVFMGAGVLAYFSLRFEPPVWWGAAVAFPAFTAVVFGPGLCRPVLLPVLAAAIGFLSGAIATARAPPIEAEIPSRATIVAGVVRSIELLPDGRRITLEDVRLDGGDPLRRFVRIRLKGGDDGELATGDALRVRALIRRPSWPAYPGGWDLQRDAYFAGLGGSGFALNPAERISVGLPSAPLSLVQRLREVIANRVSAAIPGAAGQVSVTLLTGAQTGIPEAEHQAFRDSGLAHLLAVAGLHIGIVMGFFLALARSAFALSAHASLFWPTKRLAALIALAAGGAYMVLTGMHVPIVRSFSMACLFTIAIFAGRNPVSLRGLAVAAVVLMLISPQEVPGVSFQMSFSAVLALISGYEVLRPWLRRLHGKKLHNRLLSHIAALALTSTLAGVASAPYGAYHFGHLQLYFVISNMVAVPLTAFWVMPAGMIGLALMPIGLDQLALIPMGWGVEMVVWIATTTASWPAATIAWPHMPAWGLAVLSVGLAWLGLWRTRLRLAGMVAIGVGVASPWLDRPADLLMSAEARLIGVRTSTGVFIQRAQGGNAFTRDNWLQYWAADSAKPIPKEGEAADGAISCDGGACLLQPRGDRQTALLVQEAKRFVSCRGASVIVSLEPARGLCPKPWPRLADRFTTWREGSVAIWLDPGGLRILTDREERGSRPWVPPLPTPTRKPPPSSLPPAAVDGAN